MKKIYFYFLGIMLTASFSACTSEDEFAGDFAEPAKTFKVSIPATFIDADTRAVELSDDGNYLKAYFKEGDQIRVFKSNYDYYVWNQRDLVTISSTGTTTTLEGTLTNQFKVGDELLLSYMHPDNASNSMPYYGYGVQDGTFTSKWDFAYAKVEVVSVDAEKGILETQAAKFKNSQSYFILSFVDKSNNPIKAKSVRIESSKIFASNITPKKNSDDLYYNNYRVFLETPSSDVWVVMTINEAATEDEEVTFIVEAEDGKLYKGTKNASVGDAEGKIKNGKFYSSTIELEPTEFENNLKIESDNYALDNFIYNLYADAKVTGKSYSYRLYAQKPNITITLENVDITNEGTIFSNYSDDVTINLVGNNYMTNSYKDPVGVIDMTQSYGSLAFKGEGTLVINNTNFNPLKFLNVTFEDNLVATYDPLNRTLTIAPANSYDAIIFEDENVKDVCLTHWDTNNDGLISYAEAKAVTDLGTAFKGNTTIKHFQELRLFTGLTAISESAFEGCTALETITVPNIISIEKNAFKGVTAMEMFALPPTLTKIGESAFEGCTALKGSYNVNDFYFLKSVEEIGANAFKDCTSLASLIFRRVENIKIGTSAFESTNIGANGVTFTYDTSGGKIDFGDRAFAGSKLRKINMNAATNVSFGKEVFSGCESFYLINMRDVTTPPKFGENMFKDTMIAALAETAEIIVPSASVNAYKAADGWSVYAAIIKGY